MWLGEVYFKKRPAEKNAHIKSCRYEDAAAQPVGLDLCFDAVLLGL